SRRAYTWWCLPRLASEAARRRLRRRRVRGGGEQALAPQACAACGGQRLELGSQLGARARGELSGQVPEEFPNELACANSIAASALGWNCTCGTTSTDTRVKPAVSSRCASSPRPTRSGSPASEE